MIDNLQIPDGYDIYYTFKSNLEDVVNSVGKNGKNQTYFDIPFLQKQNKVIDYFNNKTMTVWKDSKGLHTDFLIKIYHSGFNIYKEILYKKNQSIKCIIVSDQEIGVLSNKVEFIQDRLYSYYIVTFGYIQLCYPYSPIIMSNDCKYPNKFDLSANAANISSPVGGKSSSGLFSHEYIVDILNIFISHNAKIYEIGNPTKWTLSIIQDLKLIPSLENIIYKIENGETCKTQDILKIKLPYYLSEDIHILFERIKTTYYVSNLESRTEYVYSLYNELVLKIILFYTESNLEIMKWKEKSFLKNNSWNIDVQIKETLKNLDTVEKNINKLLSPNDIMYNQVKQSVSYVRTNISNLNTTNNFSLASNNVINSVNKFHHILNLVVNPRN